MLFNSLAFFLFFPIVTAIYFALPHRWRWLHLLLASCYFYMFFVPVYVLILAGTIVIDYFAGILISGAEGRRRRLYLIASLAANIGVLAFFKYYNFLNATLLQLTGAVGAEWPLPFLGILLPIGLSFHTFQAMSYTIEVYRGHQPPERHFGIYALYVMFYPQLVAGPIERPQNLLPQFHRPHVVQQRRRARRTPVDAAGALQEGRRRRHDRAGGQRRLCRSGEPRRPGARLCDRPVRRPDLRRFLRLLGHRPGRGARHGVRADGQLQPALSRALGVRVLEALAHLACRRGSATTSTCRSAAIACRIPAGRPTC